MDQATIQLQLPDGFRLLKTQVAGHTFQSDTESVGLLQDASKRCVLKPLGKPACGERELGFYESLHTDPVLLQAKQLVPKFYNKLPLVVNRREHMFLQLENLTHGMSKPGIMDIKIGKRTWDPLASPQKRSVEEQKYARCKQVLGLCVPGFQLYTTDGADGEVKMLRHGKEYGKQLDADGFRDTIARFFNVHSALCVPLLREVLQQLYAIRSWFSVQTLLHFYASSLLLAYDFEPLHQAQRQRLGENGNAQADVNACDDQPHETPPHHPALRVQVKMIDFAHVFPAECGALDTNYMFGLQNLITVIEDLIVR